MSERTNESLAYGEIRLVKMEKLNETPLIRVAKKSVEIMGGIFPFFSAGLRPLTFFSKRLRHQGAKNMRLRLLTIG